MQARNYRVSWWIIGILMGGTETAVWAACPGGTCYVDDNCSTPTDGTSGDPDCTIQEGINRAANGETVLVRAGTYAPIEFNARGITVRRETTDILPRITHTGGTIKVKFIFGDTSILDGFEISGGSARGVSATTDSAPTIKNCTIKQNNGSIGGGILLEDSNAQVINCIIENNQVTSGRGGGIYITNGSAAQITGCLIQGNTAYSDGGGIAVLESFPVITNCVISGNTANGSQGGGGIWVNDAISVALGGTNPTCAQGCSGSGRVGLTNCLIVGNSAPNTFGRGGGLFLSLNDLDFGGWTEISNCTISGNTAAGDGDGIFALGRCFTLRNSILWDDSSGFGSEITLEDSSAFLRYDDLEDGIGNVRLINSVSQARVCEETTSCGVSGNINSNPNFCGAPTDYSLCRVSPCIDAGDNAAVPAGITVDLADAPRFVNDLCTTDTGCGSAPIVDMGAYEFQVAEAQILDWKSLVTHGASNTIGLVVGTEFSESRNGGVIKLRLSFSSPIDPTSVSPSNVTICGNDVNDQSIDLSGITITTAVLSGDTDVDINFSPKLPNYARYRVHLADVEDVDCNVISTNNERIFTSLFCDATGDRVVNSTDVGLVRSKIGTSPIDPNQTSQVRSDVDNDNDIDQTDTDSVILGAQAHDDARYITDPSCP